MRSGLDRTRSTGRFASDDPLPGMFASAAGSWEISLCDVSVTGAQIEHAQPLRPALQGRLTIAGLEAIAVVVWTRLMTTGRYRSGLRLEEKLDVVAAAIRDLLSRGVIHKIQDTGQRREEARRAREQAQARLTGIPVPSRLPAEAIETIRAARAWLLRYPDEALRCQQRARKTATEDVVLVAGSGRLNREDVLAVWEYLERRFAVGEIISALAQP